MEKQNSVKSEKALNRILIVSVVMVVITVLGAVVTFIFSFSTTPKYYTYKQIDKYVDDVFGEEYTFIEESKDNCYVYEDVAGVQFTVEAYSEPVISFMTDHLPIYRKAVIDDYIESAIIYHMEDIKRIASDNGLEAKTRANSVDRRIYVIIEDEQQIEAASKAIADIDGLLNINIDYDAGDLREYSWQNHKSPAVIKLCLKPQGAGEDWEYKYENEICEFEISLDDDSRLKHKKVLRIINLNI